MSLEVGQLVVGDPVQPRRGGERARVKPAPGHDRGRECLGGEVGGRLRIVRPTGEVLEQGARVAVVEQAKRLSSARSQELLVGWRTGRHLHMRTLAPRPSNATSPRDRYARAPGRE